LLRRAFANRSSPRVVTGKWLLKHEKLITGPKNKTWTNPQVKNHKTAVNLCRHNTKTRTHVFNILNTTNTFCGENCEFSWVQVIL